ncbi:N-6 DNA methylase [Haloglomus litoreum]|uniref:N-6 DNA methylase n=1 Tax=Haloglomus litoreum TaxID=3034026 RepID=UPI0023E8DE6F|nr:N-6 DNA methylase [Haloglomus sp. DT116]
MSNTRERRTGQYRAEFPLFRTLLTVGLDDVDKTSGVKDNLGCCTKTALNKLHRLDDFGVIESEKFGNSFRWTLNTQIDFSSEVSTIDDRTVTELLSETILRLAQGLNGSITTSVTEWATERVNTENTPIESYSARVAVFNRFLKATLYSLHQKEEDSLAPLSLELDWSECFDKAHQLTENQGFKPSLVDEVVKDSPGEVDSILLALRNAFIRSANPASVLSDTYEALVSQSSRRNLGQFATPPHISEFMASWTVQNSDDRVLDPGIGAGQLSYQVLSKKIEKGAAHPLRDLTGIDIDEIAITMAATSLKLADGGGSPDLHQGDFIQFSPIFSGKDRLQEYDGVIGNPPYSRHQALDNQMKSDLNRVVSDETGFNFLEKTPLYGYFLIHSAQFLTPGGRAAFIIPSRFMDTNFGRKLKQYLLRRFAIHAVIQLDDSVEVFEGVRTRPSILLLEAASPDSTHETQFVRVNEWPSTSNAEEFLSDTESLAERPEVDFVTGIAQEILTPTERWTHYFSETDIGEFPELVPFNDVATIKRGIATGKNDFFCLSSDDVDRHSIPRQYRERILRTARGLDILNIKKSDWEEWRDNGDDVWLLYCFDEEGVIDKSEIECQSVLNYLEKGEKEGVTDGTLVSGRNPWYRVDSREPTPILGKYMNRNGFQFYRNEMGLLTLNNVHNISLDFDYKDHDRDALLAYLNSTFVERILSKSSHDYSGLEKLEISQLESAPVIDPRELDEPVCSQLAELFEGLCAARREGDGEKEAEKLSEIDQQIESILGLEA